MKQQVDQHCSEINFEVGDQVFLRLQPYKPISMKQKKRNNKLSPRYYKPYQIMQKIGSVSYKLELPPTTKIHPVFHVMCLKKVIGQNIPTQRVLQELYEEGRIILEPECILQTHIKKLRSRTLTQYLIQWKNLPVEEATWEDEEFIQKNPHLVSIEDNASLKRGGMVQP